MKHCLPVSFVRWGSRLFSGEEDLLSNVSAGAGLPATAERAWPSARYHAQDGCHPGETIFRALLAGVAYVPCVSKNGVQDFEAKLSDVEA